MDICHGANRVGCPFLLDKIQGLAHLSLHVFGHIHYSAGHMATTSRHYVNAAILGEDYKLANKPIVVELN
jgi:Icc-related predicted phosphoesterase